MTSCTGTSTGCGSPGRQRTMCSGSGHVTRGRRCRAASRRRTPRSTSSSACRRRSARPTGSALESTATVKATRKTPRSRRACRGSITRRRAPPRITTATPVAPAPSVSSRNGEPRTAPVATESASGECVASATIGHDRLRQRRAERREQAAGRAGAELEQVAGPLDRVGEQLRRDRRRGAGSR